MLSGRPAEGEGALRRALTLAERILGPVHRGVAEVLTNYAASLRRIKRTGEAKKLEKRARAILQRHAGDTVLRNTVDVGQLSIKKDP